VPTATEEEDARFYTFRMSFKLMVRVGSTGCGAITPYTEEYYMHTLVNEPSLTTIYCCDKGGIHLVVHNVNVGMTASEFAKLNDEVQEARERIDEGNWPSPFVGVTYKSTMICLLPDTVSKLADAMLEAMVGIEYLYELGVIAPNEHGLCEASRPHVAGFAGPNKNIDKIDTNQLLKN